VDAFIARQPIFDMFQRVYGYELLFRSSWKDTFYHHADPDQATSDVIYQSCFLLDLDTYSDGKRLFINVTRDTLLEGYVNLLPKDFVVLEILESVEADPEVIAACRQLKESGYLLALDDYVDDGSQEPLLELADMVKVDFMATEKEERSRLAKQLRSQGHRLVAEKIETPEAFQEAKDAEFEYFQGFFFKVPTIVRSKDIMGLRLHYMNLMTEIYRHEFDIPRIETIIKQDVSLTYKLLRLINSAFFGLPSRVHSIRHALLLLGERETKRWATLAAMNRMAADKPKELMTQALTRARFCELLAIHGGMRNRDQELFFMGMLSLIDVIMGQPLETILKSLPLEDDIIEALSGQENRVRRIFDCVLAYENADWERLSTEADRLHLQEAKLPGLYKEALAWAQDSSYELARAA
jgi:EAL and modified HD-GYP domain-containing signal transduction protein